jgi:hypothetical protein
MSNAIVIVTTSGLDCPNPRFLLKRWPLSLNSLFGELLADALLVGHRVNQTGRLTLAVWAKIPVAKGSKRCPRFGESRESNETESAVVVSLGGERSVRSLAQIHIPGGEGGSGIVPNEMQLVGSVVQAIAVIVGGNRGRRRRRALGLG